MKSALFSLPPRDDLTLTHEELAALTGSQRMRQQREWLTLHRWHYHLNRAGQPVVGRLYANLTLIGLDVRTLAQPTSWEPDYSANQ